LFRTDGTANTGVTGLVLAVFADASGKPGEVLGSGSVSGTPAVSSWVKVGGLSVPVVAGTSYWLVALPLGKGFLHYDAATAVSGGTGNVESVATGLAKATAESSWETYGQGPVGFQANGSIGGAAAAPAARVADAPAARVAVAGAPQVVTAGTAVQLSALVTGAGPVAWSTSAGEI